MYIAQRPDLLRNGVSRSQGTSPANASRGPRPRRKLRRKRLLLARAEPSAEPLGRAWATMRALLAQLLLWLCYAAASRSQVRLRPSVLSRGAAGLRPKPSAPLAPARGRAPVRPLGWRSVGRRCCATWP
eukprot:scaffold3687_cov240-Pinguiococcus_pyrenoidosus.AAC.1